MSKIYSIQYLVLRYFTLIFENKKMFRTELFGFVQFVYLQKSDLLFYVIKIQNMCLVLIKVNTCRVAMINTIIEMQKRTKGTTSRRSFVVMKLQANTMASRQSWLVGMSDRITFIPSSLANFRLESKAISAVFFG